MAIAELLPLHEADREVQSVRVLPGRLPGVPGDGRGALPLPRPHGRRPRPDAGQPGARRLRWYTRWRTACSVAAAPRIASRRSRPTRSSPRSGTPTSPATDSPMWQRILFRTILSDSKKIELGRPNGALGETPRTWPTLAEKTGAAGPRGPAVRRWPTDVAPIVHREAVPARGERDARCRQPATVKRRIGYFVSCGLSFQFPDVVEATLRGPGEEWLRDHRPEQHLLRPASARLRRSRRRAATSPGRTWIAWRSAMKLRRHRLGLRELQRTPEGLRRSAQGRPGPFPEGRGPVQEDPELQRVPGGGWGEREPRDALGGGHVPRPVPPIQPIRQDHRATEKAPEIRAGHDIPGASGG